MRLFRSVAFVLLLGCGPGALPPDVCKTLTLQYVNAFRGATVCTTPGGSAPNCTVLRPRASRDPQGSPFLCTNCDAHVEASAVPQLDALLQQFSDNSCAGTWQIDCPGCVTTAAAVCSVDSSCQ